jgi:hypothetical protein
MGFSKRLSVVMLVLACVATAAAAAPPASDLDRLAAMLAGDYSNEAQATADPDYSSVLFHVAPIWQDRTDGKWFYVEQALELSASSPYRQRVYQLVVRKDGRLESRVYAFEDPKPYVGAWRAPELLKGMSPEKLLARDGCAVALVPKGDGFAGATEGTQCQSDLRGAAYATSEVTLTASEMRSWDRGFDGAGKQVWGPTKGPYVFVKQAPAAK